jgi:hypothetical protein
LQKLTIWQTIEDVAVRKIRISDVNKEGKWVIEKGDFNLFEKFFLTAPGKVSDVVETSSAFTFF